MITTSNLNFPRYTTAERSMLDLGVPGYLLGSFERGLSTSPTEKGTNFRAVIRCGECSPIRFRTKHL